MKKIIFLLDILLFICSCQSSTGNSSDESINNLRVEDLNFVGEFHNILMSNASSNFNITSNKKLDEKSRVDSVLLFNINTVNKMALDSNEKEDINNFLKKYRNFIVSNKFETLIDGTSSTRATADSIEKKGTFEEIVQDSVFSLDEIPSLTVTVKELFNNGNIDETSMNIYTELINLIEKSCAGLISDEELTKQVNNLIDKFNISGYNKGSYMGVSAGATLSISKASLEWWKANKSAIPNDSKIPHVIAMDIGGAIYGAALNAVYQTAFNKNWSWKSFGWSVASGAASGSLGMAGKVWKWLNGH